MTFNVTHMIIHAFQVGLFNLKLNPQVTLYELCNDHFIQFRLPMLPQIDTQLHTIEAFVSCFDNSCHKVKQKQSSLK